MSTKRKGETSYKETVFGIIGRSKLIPLEIEGIKRAWDFVLVQSRKGTIATTPIFLQKIHKVGFGWIFPKMGGTFRTIEVTVSKHKLPRAYLVHQLMREFCEDLKVRFKHLPNVSALNFLDSLVDLLAWAHHQRLLINIILLNVNLPPIELKVETQSRRSKYVKALQAADEGYNYDLKKVILSALEEATRKFSK